jgi:4-diphosphocytidyl-2-C-methyl-D-erythritol kinase
VNLSLNVLGKRPVDGYHDVDMVMLPVSVADTVRIKRADTVRVVCRPDIAGPAEANLAFKAAQLLKSETGYRGGALIEIDKVIPVAGGMAGGSTNGAAALKGLNRLWDLSLTDTELERLAMRLGSDVPFFIAGRPARVQGIGDQLCRIPVNANLWLVLATPPVVKSTGNVYRWFDELEHVDRPDVAAMEHALAQGDLAAIAEVLGNVFEQVMMPRHPEIAALKDLMIREGAVGALMSGAGPTVFGLVPDEEAGRALVRKLTRAGQPALLAHTVN